MARMRSVDRRKSPSLPTVLPPGSSRLHYVYWALIFLLTMAFGFGPLYVFVQEIQRLHGRLSAVAFWLVPMGLATASMSLLPASFYQCQPFERGGRIYERLGVHYFRFLAPHGDGINWLVRRSQPGYRVVRNRQTIADYQARTIGAEAFHLACLIVVMPAAVYATVAGWRGMALWLTLPSIPLHLYPALLQRYTRARIIRNRGPVEGTVIDRLEKPTVE